MPSKSTNLQATQKKLMPSYKPFSGRPHRVRRHNTCIDTPSVEEEVENGEDEEAASHQRSQHSEELLEVDVIVRTAGRRQRERGSIFKS